MSKKLKSVWAAAALLFCLQPNARSLTWYVSTNGSDFNPGTNTTVPLRHVQTAVNRASYGDTINIWAGVYREQVYLAGNPPGNGSPTNMLTIQAWPVAGHGAITPNEIPTINAFQEITNWTALTNKALWTSLTGGIPYQSNTIFWTYWSTNDTTNEAFYEVADSDTTALLPTALPNYNPCEHPLLLTNMTQGTFQYDYTNHILYVWCNTTNPPGPAFPVQAPFLDPSAGPMWGGGSPLTMGAEYIHLKNLKFKYSNNADSVYQQGGPAATGVSYYSIIEHCSVEWAAALGIFAVGGTLVTNCTFISCNLAIQGSNEVVTGCTFSNVGWQHFEGGCQGIGCVHVQNGYSWAGGTTLDGSMITNCFFINNWLMDIHVDTSHGTSSNLFLIVNNLLMETNPATYRYGVYLERSSYCGMYNNIMFIAGTNNAICSDGGSGNVIVNNTIYGGAITVFPEPFRPGGPLYSSNNVVANNIIASVFDEALISAAADSTIWAGPEIPPVSYNNVYANNLFWNFLPSTNLDQGAPWFDLSPQPYGLSFRYTNLDTWAELASGNDAIPQNSGNFVANPLFHNPTNLTDPTQASFYVLASNSPAILNAVTNNYGVTYDYLGHPRGAYSVLGAFQRPSTPPTITPPSLLSVIAPPGPSQAAKAPE